MSISMIGIDYNKANVDIRAMFSFTKKNATAAMERLKKIPGIQGCVILSTCNRMELWASTKADWDGTLLEELCKIKEVDPTQYGEYFVQRNEEEAVDHLFHLTSGLKSMILAEDQIITQVKDALTLAREAFVTDNVLEVLFRKAVTAGKKVKTNVIFSRANQTAMDQAIEMLKERKFPLSDASPNYTLTKEQVEKLSLKKQIVFIDLAVPRDMEPGLSEIEGVELYTIDDFKLSGPSAATIQSMEQAEAIIQEEIDDFYVWYQGRALIPRIQEIKEDAVTDLNLRLHKILGKLPLSEQERKDLEASIDTAAGKVVTKMIFGLRDTLETDAFIDCVEGLEKVYEE